MRPSEINQQLAEKVKEAIRQQFPVMGKRRQVDVEDIEVQLDKVDSSDFTAQKKAKLEDGTLAAPVKAKVVVRDLETGKVVGRKKIQLAKVPVMTPRYSFLVGGKEYQITNQFLLKPGIYTRVRKDGTLASEFHIRGQAFDVTFDPETRKFGVKIGGANVDLVPILLQLGITEEQLKKAWGPDILAANKPKGKRAQQAPVTFAKKLTKGKQVIPPDEVGTFLKERLLNTELSPDVTKVTLGKEFTAVTPDSFLAATGKLLRLSRGEATPDNRESLVFKRLRGVPDIVADRLGEHARKAAWKIRRNVDRLDDPRRVVPPNLWEQPIMGLFKNSSLSNFGDQTNPMEMVTGSLRTTIMGEGGIQTPHAILDEVKLVDPSHFAFLDPLHTPEDAKTGVTLTLAEGARLGKDGPKALFYDLKEKKFKFYEPRQLLGKKIAYPDQVKFDLKKMSVKPVSAKVEVHDILHGKLDKPVSWKDVDLAVVDVSQTFSPTTNLIPFVPSNNPVRATTGTRQLTQALSLKYREPPLVRAAGTSTLTGDSDTHFGKLAAITAPVSGEVTKVTPDAVYIKGQDGKTRRVALYNHFPLNNGKGMLHSEPLVKPGDKVTAGKVIADTNYTKNGVLALGKNLLVAYMPFKGLTFEDGVVISESAAKKLTSLHLYRKSVDVGREGRLSKKAFQAYYGNLLRKENADKLDDDGVIKPGMRVEKGEVLVAGLRKAAPTTEAEMLRKLHKSLVKPLTNAALTWDKDYPGVVTDVVKKGNKVTVLVRAEQPMTVGDKLCVDSQTQFLTTRGWKYADKVDLCDQVACYNPEGGGRIEWHHPLSIHHYHDGSRYVLRQEDWEVVVSANHKMWTTTPGSPTRVSGSEESNSGVWQLRSIDDIVRASVETGTPVRVPFAHTCLSPLHPLDSTQTSTDDSTQTSTNDAAAAKGSVESVPEDLTPILTGDDLKEVKIPLTVYPAGHQSYHHLDPLYNLHDAVKVEVSVESLRGFLLYGYRVVGLTSDEVWRALFHTDPKYLRQLLVATLPEPGRWYHVYNPDLVQALAVLAGIRVDRWHRQQRRRHVSSWDKRQQQVKRVVTPTSVLDTSRGDHLITAELDSRRPLYGVEVPTGVVVCRRQGRVFITGNSGRHGNKGIVTRIVPDGEMPRTKDGKVVDVLMNPMTVPGRINLGQVLETAASKVAAKTGKPFLVPNFGPQMRDNLGKVKEELKKHGLSDKETLIDPKTGKELGQVQAGYQYIIKLKHQVESKAAARSGGAGYAYDSDLIPKGGGPTGGKSIGNLGVYALLAHGLYKNLQEMHSWKVDMSQADQLWTAIQKGQPPPAPRPSFAYNKFVNLLRAAGVDVKKTGNVLTLQPLTDDDIKRVSAGEIKDPGKMVPAKDPTKPEKGGLFDPKVTGGLDGKNWAHIELPEPVPNPLFAKAAASVLGMTERQFEDLAAGKIGIDSGGNIVSDPDKARYVGGPAIEYLLKKVDVDKELQQLKKKLPHLRRDELDRANRRYKYLQNLKKLQMRPEKAYMNKLLPVLPPVFRPLAVDQNGDIVRDDLNEMYKGVGLIAKQLKDLRGKLPDSELQPLRADLWDALKAYTGLGTHPTLQYKGILNIIEGKTPRGNKLQGAPKHGFFQKKLIGARQDMSAYSTITPNPQLSLDEVGIPKALAKRLYEPFVVKKLKELKGVTPLQAKLLIKKDDPVAEAALKQVMQERPVLIKRDPALHKYSVQAFKPVLTEGRQIQIHPLVTGGFNADFDGNCCIASSKIVLTTDEIGATLLKEQLERKGVAPMLKKNEHLFVLEGSDEYLAEIEIQHLPVLEDAEPLKDKNGNPVYPVDPRFKVLSYSHEEGRAKFCRVLGLTVEEGAPVVEVSTNSGRSVTVSDNESLCVYDHETGGVSKVAPKDARDAFVPVVRKIPFSGSLFSYDVGWLFGAFVSDGWITDAGTVGYSKVSGVHKDVFIKALGELDRGNKNLKVKWYTDYHVAEYNAGIGGKSSKIHVTGLSDVTKEWFESCYSPDFDSREDKNERRSLYKQLPEALDLFSEDTLWGILAGLIEGDGSLSRNKNGRFGCQFHTSSPYLRDSVLHLCQFLGVRVKATEYGPKEGRIQTHKAWMLSFSIVDIAEALATRKLRLLTGDYDDVVKELVEKWEGGQIKDDRDVVPVPEKIITYLASSKSPLQKGTRRSLATIKSKSKPHYYISRQLAQRIVADLKGTSVNADFDVMFRHWKKLVEDRSILWERVKDVTPAGKEKVCDLVVPETKVFAVANGFVIWDTMSAYVPVSAEAVKEAYRAMPSRNLFSPATGEVMYTPSKEMVVGLFLATRPPSRRSNKSFKTLEEGYHAAKRGDIRFDEEVTIAGKKTTVARAKLLAGLPPDLRQKYGGKTWDKKVQKEFYRDLAKKYPQRYSDVINHVKDLADEYMYETGFSLGLDDYQPQRQIRDKMLPKVLSAASKVRATDKKLRVIDLGSEAMFKKLVQQKQKKPDNLFLLTLAGVKPGPEQYRQIALAPMLMQRPDGSISPEPVTRSFSEGLRLSDYWVATSGARKGIIMKVQSVQEPGALTKMMMNTVLDRVVTDQSCSSSDSGDSDGISVDVSDPDDVLHRVLAKPVKAGRHTIPAGTVVTPEIMAKLQANKVGKVVVRSPLRCSCGTSNGLCAECFGIDKTGKLPEPGDNLGVVAAQALGERAMQLTLKAFHGGGVVPFGGTYKQTGLVDMMGRVNQLLTVPKQLPDAAPLAKKSGRVEKIEKDPAGGWRLTIGGVEHYVPQKLGQPRLVTKGGEKPLKVGMEVQRGDQLAPGPVNPHQLLELKGLDSVQRYLTDELFNIYKPYGIDKRHVELVVGAMTDTAMVEDPGDVPGFVRGDKIRVSTARALNRKLPQGAKKMKIQPVLRGVDLAPFDLTEDWQALLNHQRLSQTLVEAAQQGWPSQLDATNPIPPLILGMDISKQYQRKK